MDTRRVFIVWAHPLFRETLKALLNVPGIEIVGTGSQQKEALIDMQHTRPDIIIVEETEDGRVAEFEALEILKACPWDARVIRLSLQDNELWVYHHQRRSVDSQEQFLRLVQDL